jgi:hypothetical protein
MEPQHLRGRERGLDIEERVRSLGRTGHCGVLEVKGRENFSRQGTARESNSECVAMKNRTVIWWSVSCPSGTWSKKQRGGITDH